MLAELLEEGEAGLLVRKFVQRALDGDPVALRVCFERLVAKAGPAPVELDLAPGAESDPAAVVTAAIRGMADGEVTPREAAAIAGVALTAKKVLGTGKAERREAAPAEETEPVAGEAPPAIRLYSVPGNAAAGRSRFASEVSGAALQGAAASPVSGQYPTAAARRQDTVRNAVTACG